MKSPQLQHNQYMFVVPERCRLTQLRWSFLLAAAACITQASVQGMVQADKLMMPPTAAEVKAGCRKQVPGAACTPALLPRSLPAAQRLGTGSLGSTHAASGSLAVADNLSVSVGSSSPHDAPRQALRPCGCEGYGEVELAPAQPMAR
jgi:hypothetical protein